MARQVNDIKLNNMINRWKQMNFNRHLKQELQDRAFYVKPSVERQQMKHKAEYKEMLNRNSSND